MAEPVTLEALAPLDLWVYWRLERETKVPYSARGGPGRSNDPSTWSSLAEAERAYGAEAGERGGVGVVLGMLPCGLLLCGLDLDTCVSGGAIEPWAQEIVDRLATYTEVSPSGTGVKAFFTLRPEASDAFRRSAGTTVWRRPGAGRHQPAIELYAWGGRYFTTTGRHVAGTPREMRELDLAALEWLARDAAPRFLGREPGRPRRGGVIVRIQVTPEDLAAAFRTIPNDERGWEDWNSKGMAIWACSGGTEEGYEIFREWSARAQCYDARATRERWEHWRRSPPSMVNETTVLRWAREAQPGWLPPSWQTTAESPAFSDDWLALRFVDQHVTDARFTAAWSRWSHWDGARWAQDDRGRVPSWARLHLREVARESTKKRGALASHSTLANVVRMAQIDQRIATGPETWDHDPWTLATPGGTVDLRTGRVREAEPNEYISKLAGATPGGVAPAWEGFLAQVFEPPVAAFMRRVAGYCLTGSTREEKLFFLHGSGGNGKGTFVETLGHAMGEYAVTVAMTTLAQQKHGEHPTEIAKLRGARFAAAQETEEGSRWNATRIKTLTGGDRLTARFMRQDYFEFDPTHKLAVTGNRKPLLGRVEDAIRRRMVLVPFERSFVDREDQGLKDRLRAEAAGVLGWAVGGCLEWQRVGLAVPESIRRATDEYLHDQDDVQVWIDECCVVGPEWRTSTGELFKSWATWCERTGGYVGSRKSFAEALKGKCSTLERGSHNLTYAHGLAVAPDETPEPPESWPRDDRDEPF